MVVERTGVDAGRARRVRGVAPWLLALAAGALASGLDEPLRTGSAVHVEAAYLVNFLRFSEWPASTAGTTGQPLVIAVVGSDRVVQVVEEVAAAAGSIAGRPVLVRDVDYRSRRGPGSRLQRRALQRLRASHLVFVDESAAGEMEGVVQDLFGLPVLTVSNQRGFLEAGGMLELLPDGNKIAFAASPEAIQRAGLVLSAKVLKLSRPAEEAR